MQASKDLPDRFHPWEHHLGLRITEAGVVLQHLGAIFSEHQTKENDPLKFSALRSHGIHRRLIDLFPAECIYLGGIEGTWGNVPIPPVFNP